MLDRKRYKVAFFGLWPVLAGALICWSYIEAGPAKKPLIEPVHRETWCPTPDQRASVEVDAFLSRGADVTVIRGAAGMTEAELAKVVNLAIDDLNPAVGLRSVSLSWGGGGEAVLVLAWERAR